MPAIKYDYFSNGELETDRLDAIADVFQNSSDTILDIKNTEGLGGNKVLDHVRPSLEEIGFRVEKSKKSEDQISLSVPSHDGQKSRYHVDGYHPEWGYVLEVEGGRRDAIYKDFLKGILLNEALTLVLAVPSRYDYGEETPQSDDRYNLARREAGAIHNTDRIDPPCDIVVLGY